MTSVWVFLLWQADYGPVGLVAPSLFSYLVCIVQRLLATGWQKWVMRQLTAEPQGIPGLVLAIWWADSCSR